jgi:hypothetical protein
MYLNGHISFPNNRNHSWVAADGTLPYFAATAWFHKMLPPDLQNKDLTDMLPSGRLYYQ